MLNIQGSYKRRNSMLGVLVLIFVLGFGVLTESAPDNGKEIVVSLPAVSTVEAPPPVVPPPPVPSKMPEVPVVKDAAWYMERLRSNVEAAKTPQAKEDVFWETTCKSWVDLDKPYTDVKAPGYIAFIDFSQKAARYRVELVMNRQLPYGMEQFIKEELAQKTKPIERCRKK